MVRVIIKISQRVFAGEELCRDERWASASQRLDRTLLTDYSYEPLRIAHPELSAVSQRFGNTIGSQDL